MREHYGCTLPVAVAEDGKSMMLTVPPELRFNVIGPPVRDTGSEK